jgi:hypothetical protein
MPAGSGSIVQFHPGLVFAPRFVGKLDKRLQQLENIDRAGLAAGQLGIKARGIGDV